MLSVLEYDKKYEFVPDDTIIVSGFKLTRIRALIDIPKYILEYNISAGDLGGYIEKESNLSHQGYCWVGENAQVFGNAHVSGNAEVFGNAILCNNSGYYNSTLWLHSSTQKSLDSFANDAQIKKLVISNCPINKLIGFDQVEKLQLINLKKFSMKIFPNQLSKLRIENVEMFEHLPYLVTQKIELDIDDPKLKKLIPEFTKLQNESDKESALYIMQDILIRAGFSEEEYGL